MAGNPTHKSKPASTEATQADHPNDPAAKDAQVGESLDDGEGRAARGHHWVVASSFGPYGRTLLAAAFVAATMLGAGVALVVKRTDVIEALEAWLRVPAQTVTPGSLDLSSTIPSIAAVPAVSAPTESVKSTVPAATLASPKPSPKLAPPPSTDAEATSATPVVAIASAPPRPTTSKISAKPVAAPIKLPGRKPKREHTAKADLNSPRPRAAPFAMNSQTAIVLSVGESGLRNTLEALGPALIEQTWPDRSRELRYYYPEQRALLETGDRVNAVSLWFDPQGVLKAVRPSDGIQTTTAIRTLTILATEHRAPRTHSEKPQR